jgi:hypothetical protein
LPANWYETNIGLLPTATFRSQGAPINRALDLSTIKSWK